MIVAGAGVGGGSLVYANTLYEPLEAFYRDPSWSHICDWKAELAPYYDQAKRMLGVVENPAAHPQRRGDGEGRGRDGRRRDVPPDPGRACSSAAGDQAPGETVADPYFGGAGPERQPCIGCGECMTGCRHHAKNTLLKNYLYLAEQAGAVVHPLTTVTRVRPRDGGGYTVDARWTKAKLSRRTRHQDLHRRARGLLRRRARHPEAAAPAQGRGRPAEAQRPARLPHPHQLRGDPGRDLART